MFPVALGIVVASFSKPRAAERGETALAPPVAAKLFASMGAAKKPQVSLSGRELAVLELVSRGRTIVQIGESLYFSAATVRTYLKRIFGTLDVTDRTATTTRAIQLGLLDAGRDRA